MSVNSVQVVIAILHQVGLLVLLGSLFFALTAMLPSIAEVRSPRIRLALRHDMYRRLFRWGWLGLLLLWGTSFAHLFVGGHAEWPGYVMLMALLSALFMFLYLFAQFALQFQAMVALEEGNSERAAWLLHWLRRVLGIALVVAVLVAVLDVAGPALVPDNLFGLLGSACGQDTGADIGAEGLFPSCIPGYKPLS